MMEMIRPESENTMRTPRFGLPAFVLAAVLLAAPSVRAQGTVELGFHYGRWSVNLLRPLLEDLVADFMGQIEDKMIDKIREEYPGFKKIGSARDFAFDSSGPNLGFELRWYPGGEKGSFSLGVSMEKMTLQIEVPDLQSSLVLEDEATAVQAGFKAEAGGVISFRPLAFLLSFRWDLLPEDRIRPYVTVGLGLAGESALLDARLDYHFAGTLTKPDGETEAIAESATKTFRQLIDEDKRRKIEDGSGEEPFDLPIHFMPFVQLHFGLKGVITKNIHALVDFGILNGFLLRGGLAIRI
jgi:hypothetical protein